MNHILDVPGLRVGHANDTKARSGVTTVVMDTAGVCGVAVHGGAPGTRETDALAPHTLGPAVDAVCLSGGSAFGLASADGVQRALAAHGRGFVLGPHKIPIVPGAVVFDLSGPLADYRSLGEESVAAALDRAPDLSIGTVGAGTNATTATLKGGLGSASTTLSCGGTVGAIVVVNAVGSTVADNGPWFRAHPFEKDGEFGGLTPPPEAKWSAVRTKLRAEAGLNTVIAVVATDLTLTRGEATRMAMTAHDGLALAIWPSHTLFDGDTVFALTTAKRPAPASPVAMVDLFAAAASTLARAVARGVNAATAKEGDTMPTWAEAASRLSPSG